MMRKEAGRKPGSSAGGNQIWGLPSGRTGRLGVLVGAVVALLLLAACAGPGPNPGPNPGQPAIWDQAHWDRATWK